MSPRGRPIIHPSRKLARLTPPPEKTCPICFRLCDLIDATRGKERYACPKHGEPGKAA